jgi:hypothetical protein
MKKLFLAGVLLGIVNFANATSYTTTGLSSIDGNNTYTWGIDATALKGQTVTAATLTFYNIKLTANGPFESGGELWTHLLDFSSSSSVGVKTGVADNDALTDGFASQGVYIGHQHFASVGTTYASLTYDLGALGDLTQLTSYLADGYFGFGIDPDCHYTDTSIQFNISTTTSHGVPTPDAASTAMLLGAGLSCLGLLRRKLS